eukprot:scaffold9477_cov197-Amphora_coffeaeformis.AAC.2
MSILQWLLGYKFPIPSRPFPVATIHHRVHPMFHSRPRPIVVAVPGGRLIVVGLAWLVVWPGSGQFWSLASWWEVPAEPFH